MDLDMSCFDEKIKLYEHHEIYVPLLKKNIKGVKKPVVKFDEIKHSLPYKTGTMLLKPQVHIGQRKLFLSKLQFLINVDTKYCIYAGAAPDNKTHYLSQLFPDVKFILIDPNKFDIKLPNMTSHPRKKHKDIVHLKSGYPD